MEDGEYHNASNPWMEMQGQSRFSTWTGYAFEMLCLLHTEQIKRSIGIAAVSTNVFSWRSNQKGKGAQIDMLIDHQGRVINVCKIKFHAAPFVITKAYSDQIDNKLRLLRESIAICVAGKRALR